MKSILCAFALSCVWAFNVRADEIVIVPTGGQLSWINFPGSSGDTASLTITGVGLSAVMTNQEAMGMQWSGLCPINCTGGVTFNNFSTGTFGWSAEFDGVNVIGTLRLFAPGSIPFPTRN